MSGKRTYTIRKFYMVSCSACNEDIAEDYPDTLAEAKEQRDTHEAWHAGSDAMTDVAREDLDQWARRY